MWLIKYVEMDSTFGHHPVAEIAETYNQAKEIQSSIEERIANQNDDGSIPEEGKIVSEPILEEIKMEDTRKRKMSVDELLFCKTCHKPAKKIVAHTSIEVEMLWNDDGASYEMTEDNFNIENSTSVYCPGCMSDLLMQE
jgi:hypothetical protein